MRSIYDVTMVILFIAMAAVMFFGEYMKLPMVGEWDKTFRYLFGTICLLYGAFRLYLVTKQEY